MKARKITTLLCAAIMLTACADVPENLQSRESELENTEQAELTIQKGDIDTIRGCLKEDASKKYGTITVKYASAGDNEKMPVCKIQVCGNDYPVKELAKALYGDKYDLDDKSLYEFLPWNKNGSGLVPNTDQFTPEIALVPPSSCYDIDSFYPQNDHTCSAHVFANGTCWGAQAGLNDYGDDYDAPWIGGIKTHYYPQYEDISKVSYKMYDGTEWALTEAISFTENFWNEDLSKNDPQKFTYKVWRVDVIDLPSNDNYGYLFMMSYSDEAGNKYDCDTYDRFELQDDRIYGGERFFLGQTQWQMSLKKDEITRFDKDFSFKITEETDANSELLTLGSAMSFLEKNLAKNINLNFDTAELCYIVTCDKYPDRDYGGAVKYNTYFCTKYCDLAIRPYWCFRKTNGFVDNWNVTENYYVDAVTGEMIHIKLGLT